jgi:hypothetical protein
MSARPYYLTRKPSTQNTRACWTSPSSGELYCGICLRATIAARLGAECPACGSTIERILEVSEGGRRSSLGPLRNRVPPQLRQRSGWGKLSLDDELDASAKMGRADPRSILKGNVAFATTLRVVWSALYAAMLA